MCEGCGKRVYFAEQVSEVGWDWLVEWFGRLGGEKRLGSGRSRVVGRG